MTFFCRPENGMNVLESRTKRKDNLSVFDQSTMTPIE